MTVSTSSNCPGTYEHWHDATWPGIQQGCSCISKNLSSYMNFLDNDGGFSKLVTVGECTQLQLNSKCTTGVFLFFSMTSSQEHESRSLLHVEGLSESLCTKKQIFFAYNSSKLWSKKRITS